MKPFDIEPGATYRGMTRYLREVISVDPVSDHVYYTRPTRGDFGDMSMEEFLRWAVLEVVVKKPLTPGRKPIAFKREAA